MVGIKEVRINWKRYIIKVLNNLVSTKMWIIFIATYLLIYRHLSGEQFVIIATAFIGANIGAKAIRGWSRNGRSFEEDI